MYDLQDVYNLSMQDASISEAKKKKLASLYRPANTRLLFLAKLISFGMERPFVKRNTKNQKLIAGGDLSPAVLDYINRLLTWILRMICRKTAKKNVFGNTTVFSVR